MRAYVMSIGSELIGGHLTDTNATFLAQELAAKGIELLHVVQVGDDLDRLTRTLAAALEEADLVICTGGIGPTDDDLTREAICALAGESPVVDEEIVASIRAFFAQRGLEMPERNAKQAWVIPCAEVLPNPVGTAPGWLARIGDSMVVAMPGVPRDLFRMWREQALPRISARLTGRVYRSANLRTLGIGESAVSQLLDELTRRPQPYVGTYAKDDGVHVRVTAAADDDAAAEESLSETVAEVRRRLGNHVYAEDDRSLAQVLLDSLRQHGLTIGIAESGSGGRFGSMLLSEPAATDVVRGATAITSNAASLSASDLSRSAREQFGSSVAVGIAANFASTAQGLFEGTIDVAISGLDESEESFPIRAAFQEIQRRAALNAADVLRRALATV
ncbi:MAG: CinA family nicotinamide mononucleotide deamidase-related protein [Chloroflexi bacterium]|nr:CinA family nicotinamide mononucleotide deamidase-related protein [Chloroflexota bacterium]